MKLEWTQIKNFRSIKDSGKIYFNPNITILAGKNESGKSNILSALHSFSIDQFDESYDYPLSIDSENNIPEVIINFEIEKEDIYFFEDQLKNLNLTKPFYMKVTRSAEYEEIIESELINKLFEFLLLDEVYDNTENLFNSIIEIDNSSIRNINDINKIAFHFEEIETYIRNRNFIFDKIYEQVFLFNTEVQIFFKSIEDIEKNELEIQQLEHLEKLVKQFKIEFNNFKKTILNLKSFLKRFQVLIPNFIYFNSFEDIIPNSIKNEEDHLEMPIIKRFFKVANEDPDKIFNENKSQRRKIFTDNISAKISGDFMDYYSQDEVSLKIDIDGENINFFVYGKDDKKPFEPKQRSQGLQWFLAFYLTLQAERQKGSILLIDEPGLYLHATAQEDLLKMLEKISEVSPVVFSTHSQWLMNPNRLERLRLVIKNNDDTFVENKIHKGADNDTMKPIITAIGLEAVKDIRSFSDKVLLVEGYSDYYYLSAIRFYLNKKGRKFKDFQIYPCNGSSQIMNVLTLIIDSKTDFKILLDNDAAGKRDAKKLQKDCGIEIEKIIFTNLDGKEASSIEDLFSELDMQNLILDDKEKTLKGNDKVLLSKKFNEKVHNDGENKIILSEETIANFLTVFDKI